MLLLLNFLSVASTLVFLAGINNVLCYYKGHVHLFNQWQVS